MDEYIGREVAKKELLGWALLVQNPGYMKRDDAMYLLDHIPAADVAPVVHGHFVHDGSRIAHGVDWWHCSNCGRLASGVETRFAYCPWCGARMDGDCGAKAD